jgi:hypothetical protein
MSVGATRSVARTSSAAVSSLAFERRLSAMIVPAAIRATWRRVGPELRRAVGLAHGTVPHRTEEDEMTAIRTTVDDSGRAYIDLASGDGGEIRDSIELSEFEDDRVPALGSLVLHFDFYGRLAAVEVTDSAASVLPPTLLDAAERV